MLAIIEAVAMPPENGMREVKRFAYTLEESRETPESVRGDSLQDANHALEIVKKFSGASITEGMPPRGDGYTPMYVVQVQVSGTHKKHSHYRSAYHKFDGCPLNVIADMMDIYGNIRKVLRGAMVSHRERIAAKKAAKKKARAA
jgi:hypothetical protein